MQVKLKLVQVKESVPFRGPADMTLQSKDGEIIYDSERRVVLAKHPSRDPMGIPMENVRFFVEYGDVAEAAAQAALADEHIKAAEAKKRTAARKAAEDPNRPKGVTKFERDPATGALVEKQV